MSDACPRKSTTAKKRWADRVVQLFGGMNLVASVVDIVSDLLVAAEFYNRNAMLWFYLVVVSLVVSNCVYAFLGVDEPLPALCRRIPLLTRFVTPRPNKAKFVTGNIACVVFVLALPFAQLLPLLDFVMHRWQLYDSSVDAEVDHGWKFFLSSNEHSAAYADSSFLLSSEMEEDAELLRRMSEGFNAHIQEHAFFYLETFVESIPQSIVQLLALSAMDSVSTVQLVSLSISVFSIVSKAYVVARSFDLWLLVAQFSLVVLDVLGSYYIYSTLTAIREPVLYSLWPVLPNVKVSYPASLWFAGEAAFVIYCLTVACLWLVGSFVVERERLWLQFVVAFQNNRKVFCQSCGAVAFMCVVFLILSVPLFLVLQLFRLSLFTVFVTLTLTVRSNMIGHVGALWAFVAGDGGREKDARFRCILSGALHAHLHLQRPLKKKLPHAESTIRMMQSALAGHGASAFESRLFSRFSFPAMIVKAKIYDEVCRLRNVVWKNVFSAVNKFDVLLWIAVFGFCVVKLIAASISTVVPFVHAAQHWELLNGFQTFCITGSLAMIVMLFVALPKAVDALLFRISCQSFPLQENVKSFYYTEMLEYFQPSPSDVIVHALSETGTDALMPFDLAVVIGSFMRPKDLRLVAEDLNSVEKLRRLKGLSGSLEKVLHSSTRMKSKIL